METRYRELSTQLARLNRGSGSGIGEPPNPGFEPDRPADPADAEHPGRAGRDRPGGQVAGGWTVEGKRTARSRIDASNPHSGQGSLKLTAPWCRLP